MTAIVAAVLANRARWAARRVGRVAVGLLTLLGGALLNTVNLATGGDYTGFADGAHANWVITSWRTVVAPNQILFIGLLMVYEALSVC